MSEATLEKVNRAITEISKMQIKPSTGKKGKGGRNNATQRLLEEEREQERLTRGKFDENGEQQERQIGCKCDMG